MKKVKSICPICGGLGTVNDKIWGKKKCPNWRCQKGKVTIVIKTEKELMKEFRDEQDALNAQCRL